MEGPGDSPSLEKSKSKGPSIGQRELYIPSYSSPQLEKRTQDFIYPNNFRNPYQYSPYKYSNRGKDIPNQRQWSSGQTLGNSVHRNYVYKTPAIYDSSLDSLGSQFNSDSNNDFRYQRPEKLVLRQNINQNNNEINKEINSKPKSTDNSLKNKVKDFDEEEEQLAKAKVLANGPVEDETETDKTNRLRDYLMVPVMRRKSSTTVNQMHTSSLQASDQRNVQVPIAQARQQNSNFGGNNGPADGLGDFYFVGKSL